MYLYISVCVESNLKNNIVRKKAELFAWLGIGEIGYFVIWVYPQTMMDM